MGTTISFSTNKENISETPGGTSITPTANNNGSSANSSSDSGANLVPCGTERSPIVTDSAGNQTGGEILNPCGFNDLMTLINNFISFILFKLAVPIAAIAFAYAGFMLITSGGSTEKKGTAKKIFTNVALGLIFAVAAWLIVNTVLSILGYEGSWIGF
jgi:hypothetical protein